MVSASSLTLSRQRSASVSAASCASHIFQLDASSYFDHHPRFEQDLHFSPDSYSLCGVLDKDEYRDYHFDILAHAPDSIPIVEGPLRGANKRGDGTLDYGFVHVRGREPQAYEIGREHLGHDPTMRSVLLQLEDGGMHRRDGLSHETFIAEHPKSTTITTVTGLRQYPEAHYDQIKWNTLQAVLVQTGDPQAVALISPAGLLGHEMVHRFHFLTDPDAALVRSMTPVGKMLDREELLTIHHEIAFAKKMGEGQRKQYRGATVRVARADQLRPKVLARVQLAFARRRLALRKDPIVPVHLDIDTAAQIAALGPGGEAYARQQLAKLDTRTRLQRAKVQYYERKLDQLIADRKTADDR